MLHICVECPCGVNMNEMKLNEAFAECRRGLRCDGLVFNLQTLQINSRTVLYMKTCTRESAFELWKCHYLIS